MPDAAAVEQVAVLSSRNRVGHALVDHQATRSLLGDRRQGVEQWLLHARMQSERHLIHDEQAWPANQSTHDRDHLLLATAEGSSGLLEAVANHREELQSELERFIT